jgi:hypothetical protein
MTQPIEVTIACYSWFQFQLTAEYDKDTRLWRLDHDLNQWMRKTFKGRWGVIGGSYRVPLFIEDRNDAMMFKLIWLDKLWKGKD